MLLQEFAAFLSSCGDEFDAVSKEQKAMTKAEKLKYASSRLSTRMLEIPKDDDEEVGKADVVATEE